MSLGAASVEREEKQMQPKQVIPHYRHDSASRSLVVNPELSWTTWFSIDMAYDQLVRLVKWHYIKGLSRSLEIQINQGYLLFC